mgnify:CR=1 FL=1
MAKSESESSGLFNRAAPRYAGEDFVPDFASGMFRFPYRREPYARVDLQLDAGGTEARDAKVLARTGDSAFLNITFPGPDQRPVSLWIPAGAATRIRPEESSWRDPSDLEWE